MISKKAVENVPEVLGEEQAAADVDNAVIDNDVVAGQDDADADADADDNDNDNDNDNDEGNNDDDDDENNDEDEDDENEDDPVGDDEDDEEEEEGDPAPEKDNREYVLPIDLACDKDKNPPPEFIRLITMNMPPLHFLCTYSSKSLSPIRLKTLQYLLTLFPNDPTVFHEGLLPFHCACRSGAPRSVLEWWLEKNPQAVSTRTQNTNDTALHCYASSTRNRATAGQTTTATTTAGTDPESSTPPSEDVVNVEEYLSALEFLMEKHPQAVHEANGVGWLPFHVAAGHDAPLDVLFEMARQNPLALLWSSSAVVPNDDLNERMNETTLAEANA